MTKLQFLMALRERLSALPQSELEERLTFYSEMIEDRVEEGLSEQEAVAAVGSVEEIAAQSLPEGGPVKPKRRLKAWEIVLIAAGLLMLIVAFAVAVPLCVSLWAVIVSFWTVFSSLVGCAFGGVAGGVGLMLGGDVTSGTALLGAGLVCAGLAVFCFFGCKAAVRGAVWLTKRIFKRQREVRVGE